MNNSQKSLVFRVFLNICCVTSWLCLAQAFSDLSRNYLFFMVLDLLLAVTAYACANMVISTELATTDI